MPSTWRRCAEGDISTVSSFDTSHEACHNTSNTTWKSSMVLREDKYPQTCKCHGGQYQKMDPSLLSIKQCCSKLQSWRIVIADLTNSNEWSSFNFTLVISMNHGKQQLHIRRGVTNHMLLLPFGSTHATNDLTGICETSSSYSPPLMHSLSSSGQFLIHKHLSLGRRCCKLFGNEISLGQSVTVKSSSAWRPCIHSGNELRFGKPWIVRQTSAVQNPRDAGKEQM